MAARSGNLEIFVCGPDSDWQKCDGFQYTNWKLWTVKGFLEKSFLNELH